MFVCIGYYQMKNGPGCVSEVTILTSRKIVPSICHLHISLLLLLFPTFHFSRLAIPFVARTAASVKRFLSAPRV
jgi:hypothetical protein